MARLKIRRVSSGGSGSGSRHKHDAAKASDLRMQALVLAVELLLLEIEFQELRLERLDLRCGLDGQKQTLVSPIALAQNQVKARLNRHTAFTCLTCFIRTFLYITVAYRSDIRSLHGHQLKHRLIPELRGGGMLFSSGICAQ